MARVVGNGIFPEVMTADEAVTLVQNGDVVSFLGAGGGLTEPVALVDALAERFKKEAQPRNLTLYFSTCLGDRAERGLSQYASDGFVKRVYGGHWGQSPRLAKLADENKIEAYNLPLGVMSQLHRVAAAHQPGLLTKTGLGTFVDPRNTGGRLNKKTTEDILSIQVIDGEEYIFYPSIPPDIVFIRATTADQEGYLTFEDEIAVLDALAQAEACRNNGGIVICQVQKIVKRRALHPKKVRVPGYLVDVLVEVPEQRQLYAGPQINRFFSGDYKMVQGNIQPLPLTERKVVARRCLEELKPGYVGNVGVGIADGIGTVAQEENICDDFTLTVESGPIGGSTIQGIFFGASINMQALLDMPSQFDFYHGGGLDVCFLSFAEVDKTGNVNVHQFNHNIQGAGGFIDICQNTRKVVFCGTLTAVGLKESVANGELNIVKEGRVDKFVDKVESITFSGKEALKAGHEVLYVTERAVFKLTPSGLLLIEVAPGINLQRDVLEHIHFKVKISEKLKVMDSRLFNESAMGIRKEFLSKR